jgi:site-specific recombinase XerD
MRDLEATLQQFGEFLLKGGLVKEKAAPFCVRWVRRFLMRPASTDPLADQVRRFCEDLERENCQDWQVRQAEHALRIYWLNFRQSRDWVRQPSSGAADGGVEPLAALDGLRRRIRTRHYSYRTEVTYVDWARRFLTYLAETQAAPHPRVTADGARDFLTHLAVRQRVSASTQNQALCAILFLCRDILGVHIEEIANAVKAKRGSRLPVVLSVPEVAALLGAMRGTTRLMASLIYGGGLRVMEACELRVKDIDFDHGLIIVRRGKGDKDRSTLLAETGRHELREHLRKVEILHRTDRGAGVAGVWLPDAHRSQVSERRSRVRLVLGVSQPHALNGPARGRRPPTSPSCLSHTKGRQGCGGHGENSQAGVCPRASPQLRDTPAAEWRRHQADPGIPRPCQGGYDDDLHPRGQGTEDAAQEPARPPRKPSLKDKSHQRPRTRRRLALPTALPRRIRRAGVRTVATGSPAAGSGPDGPRGTTSARRAAQSHRTPGRPARSARTARPHGRRPDAARAQRCRGSCRGA